MGVARAPVAASGAAPAWMASVWKPGRRSVMGAPGTLIRVAAGMAALSCHLGHGSVNGADARLPRPRTCITALAILSARVVSLDEGSGTPGRRLFLVLRMPVSRRPTRRFLSEGLPPRRRQGQTLCAGSAVARPRRSVGRADLRRRGCSATSRIGLRPPEPGARVKLRPQAPILSRSKTPPAAPLTDKTPSLYSYQHRLSRPA